MAESVVRELETLLLDAKKTDYDSIDKIMRDLSDERDISPEDLHNAFKAEHNGQTPDAWIKENMTEMMVDDLFREPLHELFDLYELMVRDRPVMQDAIPATNIGPNAGNFEHPVTKQKNEVESLIAQGMNPVEAHRSVYGEIDLADVQSKAKFAGTLGKIQDDGIKRGVKIEQGKGSILSKDAAFEKQMDQVTRDDLRTPMNQQVPDDQQTPADQVAEDLEIADEYDYNEDVAYLQKYGRA